jgi:hypothetical protein
MTAAAVQYDSVWLRAANYEVAPLNARVSGRVSELKRALESGIPAYPDTNRANFYDVELPDGWAYIHVHDDNQTVYLVAFSLQ